MLVGSSSSVLCCVTVVLVVAVFSVRVVSVLVVV